MKNKLKQQLKMIRYLRESHYNDDDIIRLIMDKRIDESLLNKSNQKKHSLSRRLKKQ